MGMLLISIAMSLMGTFLEGVSTGCYPVDQILGFFWGTYSESYFPLFYWFIFVAAGHWFGEKYQFLRDKMQFHTVSLLVGLMIPQKAVPVIIHPSSENRIVFREAQDFLVCPCGDNLHCILRVGHLQFRLLSQFPARLRFLRRL